MTVKEYLNQAYRADRKIRILRRQRDDLQQMLYSPAWVNLGERVQSTPTPDKMGEVIATVDEKTREIETDIINLLQIKITLNDQIMALEDERHVELLQCRYILFYTWSETSTAIGYNMSWTHELKCRAIDAFYEKWGAKLSLTK